MTRNLAARVDTILEQSRQEESLPAGTLQRISLTLKRLGQDALAQTVEDFASICKPELEFFRKISELPPLATTSKVRKFQDYCRNRLTDPMLRGMQFASPFKIIEGVAVPQNKNLEQLSGPFFIAVAGDFSGGHEWIPENRSYLFSPTQNKDSPADELELRVLSDEMFKTQIMGEQGKDSRYRISLYTTPIKRGDIQELFEAVVEDMSKFAFGPKSSPTARDAFRKAVEAYEPQPRLRAINTPARFVSELTSSSSPLTLERTPNK